MRHLNALLIFIFSFCCVFNTACQNRPKTKSQGILALNDQKKKELTVILNEVYEKDQEYRQLVSSTIEKYGLKSPQIKALADKMDKADSSNVIVVKDIIAKYGWLSDKIVGVKGNSAIFLVIQHASKGDRKHLLPIMRKAVEDNAASKQDFALLEDRVAMDQGKKQLYGTQIGFNEKTGKYYVFPIENSQDVDKRRASMGMGPISVDLSQWQIHWNN